MRRFLICSLMSLLLPAWMAPAAQAPPVSAGTPTVDERLKQASANLDKGNWKAAEAILNPLLEELQQQKDARKKPQASFLLSRAKATQGDYAAAIALNESILTSLQENHNPDLEVEVSNQLGAIYSRIGKLVDAENHFNHALSVATEAKNSNGVLIAVNGLAGVYADRGDFEKSLQSYKQALSLSVSTGNKRRQAAVLNNTGLLYAGVGDYSAAFKEFEKALVLYKELDNPALVAQLLVNLADTYISVGEYLKARDAASEAYRLAQQKALAPLELLALHNLGRTMHYRGDYKAAIDNYLAALALAQATRDARNESDILNSIGETYVRLGDFKKASEYHQRAVDRVRDLNLPGFSGLFLRNVAGDYAQSHQLDEAVQTLTQALALSENSKDRRLKGFVTNDLGAIYFEEGDLKKARDYLGQALSVRRDIGDKRGVAETLMHLGITELDLKEYASALHDFDEAIGMAASIGHLETLWRAQYGKARALREQGRKAEAIQTLEDSVEVIEQIRRSVASNAPADSFFFANKQAVYETLIALLIESGDHEKAYEYLERAKSKQLQDKIRLTSIPFKSAQVRGLMGEAEDLFDAEANLREQLVREQAKSESLQSSKKIENLSELLASNKSRFFQVVNELRQTHPEYERFVTVKPPSLAKVQRMIPDDTLMLEYFPSNTRLYIFEITNTDFRLRSVAVTRDQLDRLVKSYRSEMHGTVERLRARMMTRMRHVRGPVPSEVTESSLPVVKATVTELYKSLIAPVETDMASKKVLTIIPSGLLYYLPFPALAKEDNGQLKYLIESKAVSYLSSSDLFDLVFVKTHNDERDNLVAFGNPDGTLPSALDEVERLKQIYPNSKVYMLWEAKKERLFDLPKGTELLHLATHGRLDSADVNESYIKMASEGAKDQGKLRLSEIYDLPLEKTSLVTLSACETALGEKDPGTEIASLAQAFSIAGAPTVVASLWAVYDPSTADIMDEFYRELRKGLPKVEALQRAQIAVLRNPKYSNPYFWAPFIMLGDWR